MKQNNERVEICREIHLGRTLGEGGMGTVYEGFETGLGSHAAVKVLHAELCEDAEVRERFDEEALLMASIEHPGCLPIYGWGTDQHGRPFYAMRQVSGRTLSAVFEERGKEIKSFVWRRRLLDIFQSVCETMAYAHEQGIVHRDLKPDNIMIDEFGSVYVIDWGIAKRVGSDGTSTSRTLAGAVMGSPGYMSPEQADGKTAKAGPEADVFALGVILYEILTGKSPFHGETEREAMAHTVNLEPKPPSRALLVGRSLRAVSTKALHKEPLQRYRTARPFAEDVRSYNEGQPVKVARPSPIERLFFWIRREPVRAGLSLGVIMAVLTGLAFIGVQIWIDHRIADKTMANIETSDMAIAELDGEIAEWKRKLEQPGADRAKLQHELEVFKGRRIIRQIQALNAIRSVGNLRFIRTDSELTEEGKQRLFKLFEDSVEGPHSVLLRALADSILEEIQEGVANSPYSAEDQAQLRAYRERARLHSESALESGDLSP